MVLNVIYQLPRAKTIYLIKLDATTDWLPLEVVQFVERSCFLPPIAA
jgi:hypothetical protein